MACSSVLPVFCGARADGMYQARPATHTPQPLARPSPHLGVVGPGRHEVLRVVGRLGRRHAVRRRRAKVELLDAAAIVLHAEARGPGRGTDGEKRAEEADVDRVEHQLAPALGSAHHGLPGRSCA